jgi:hypothetical protein
VFAHGGPPIRGEDLWPIRDRIDINQAYLPLRKAYVKKATLDDQVQPASDDQECDPPPEVETPVRAPLRAVRKALDALNPLSEPEAEPAPPEPVQANGMMEVPYVSGPGDGTNLADIDGPSWGPSNGTRRGPRFLGL